jgi:hypothetical protein
VLDDQCRQHMHPDVGALRCLAQPIERLLGPAPLLGHHDALGLLHHWYAPQPGPRPGKRGVARYLPLRPAPAYLVTGRPHASPGLLTNSGETFRLQPHGLQAVGVHLPGATGTWVHNLDATRQKTGQTGAGGARCMPVEQVKQPTDLHDYRKKIACAFTVLVVQATPGGPGDERPASLPG